MRRAARILAATVAVLVPLVGTAAPGGWDRPEPYAASVRVVVVPRPGGPIFTLAPTGRSGWPPEPNGTANVEEQARTAYGEAAWRIFREVVTGEADAELEISVEKAEVSERAATGAHAFVEHAIVLRARDRVELGRWRISADAEFMQTTDASMSRALARAAETAARRLEAEIGRPPRAAEWLRERGRSGPGTLRRALAHRGPYPLSVRIVVATGRGGGVYARSRSEAGEWPPEPYGTANVDAQARAAYGAMAASAFRDVVDATADLEIEISVAAVDVAQRASGSLASVEHAVVVRNRDRAELARLYVRGEAQFIASTDAAMASALNRAAQEAADQLAAELEDTPGVARWLRQRGIRRRPSNRRRRRSDDAGQTAHCEVAACRESPALEDAMRRAAGILVTGSPPSSSSPRSRPRHPRRASSLTRSRSASSSRHVPADRCSRCRGARETPGLRSRTGAPTSWSRPVARTGRPRGGCSGMS